MPKLTPTGQRFVLSEIENLTTKPDVLELAGILMAADGWSKSSGGYLTQWNGRKQTKVNMATYAKSVLREMQ